MIHKEDIEKIEYMVYKMRIKALDMAYKAGGYGAHLGGGMSSMEILGTLYGMVANIPKERERYDERDRVLIGKGHCVLAYYTALNEVGLISDSLLDTFECDDEGLIGHPIKSVDNYIDYSSGSLGMALSVGCGMALDAKNRGKKHQVYVLMGDGECQEGSVWEAVFFAKKYQLSNLTCIIDNNGLQSDGTIEAISGITDLTQIFRSFGWNTVEADGHSVEDLVRAFDMEYAGLPKAIIAKTIKGKGISFMEGECNWHHGVLTSDMYKKAREELTNARNK